MTSFDFLSLDFYSLFVGGVVAVIFGQLPFPAACSVFVRSVGEVVLFLTTSKQQQQQTHKATSISQIRILGGNDELV